MPHQSFAGGQFLDYVPQTLIDDHTRHLTSPAAYNREDWVKTGLEWPKQYLDEVDHPDNPLPREALQNSLSKAGLGDHVVVSRIGILRPGINNASIRPNWGTEVVQHGHRSVFGGGNPVVNTRRIPLEKVIGIGHRLEGEVFFHND